MDGKGRRLPFLLGFGLFLRCKPLVSRRVYNCITYNPIFLVLKTFHCNNGVWSPKLDVAAEKLCQFTLEPLYFLLHLMESDLRRLSPENGP